MKSIKTLAAILPAIFLAGCFGHSSSDNTLIGQVKKVARVTPLLCNDRTDADISLGVMRNGIGSMSTQDMWLTVNADALPAAQQAILQQVSESGAPVKVTYSVARFRWCWNNEEITSVELVK